MSNHPTPYPTQVALMQTMALHGALVCLVKSFASPHLAAELESAIDAYESQTLMLGFDDAAVEKGRDCLSTLLEICRTHQSSG